MEYDLNNGAKQVIIELRELADLTSDENGAQRIAWHPTWQKARDWFREKAESAGALVTMDAAGNIWAKIVGESDEGIAIGSHLDSVPNAGWLDGALGVVTGLEVLRRYGINGTKPKKSIYVVDWVDEEGASYGYSCLGSSAASGTLTIKELIGRKDLNGKKFEDALNKYGINPESMIEASKQLRNKNLKGYLELHIEQGPVLENSSKDISCVYGVAGVQRNYIDFTGQSAHAGSFPIKTRQDAFLAAAQAALEFRKLAIKYDAVCTVGQVRVKPDVTTIIPGKCTISLDQRTINASDLQSMYKESHEIVNKICKDNNVSAKWRKIYAVEPQLFDDQLIELCKKSIEEEMGETSYMMYSGPLHDAVQMAKVMPTVMMFVISEGGLSHTKEENTPDDKLETSVRAFLRLVDKICK